MDFPVEVDCLIDGTGYIESIISASLSILGKQVLHVDRHDHYGGTLLSLRFNELEDLLMNSQNVQSSSGIKLTGEIINLEGVNPCFILHRSCEWFLTDKEADQHSVNSVTIPPSNVNLSTNEVPPYCSNLPGSETTHAVLHRNGIAEQLRRIEFDLVPKILYSESPTITAIMRTDVTRYLEFRFISRLLAYTTVNGQTTSNANEKFHLTSEKNLRIVQIPVCRSEVFKTRLLTLRQKRSLGSFFEWCLHLTLDNSADTTHFEMNLERCSGSGTNTVNVSNQDQDYEAYKHRPFREFLTENRHLDEVLQQILITNLAMGSKQIITKQAIERIRRLLCSMNRFGQYPILWPLYGSSDLTQAYCRMAAVFGAVYCLNCHVTKIQYPQDIISSPENSLNSNSSNYIVHLSNNQQVRARFVLLGSNCLPCEWIYSFINRWYARAIFITDASLLPEGGKTTDVSLLSIPLSDSMDPAVLIETQVECSHNLGFPLFLVHLCASLTYPEDPKQVFHSIVTPLFNKYDPSTSSTVASSSDSSINKRPNVLWAGYFCVPDLSDVPFDFLQSSAHQTSHTSNDRILIVPSVDSSPDLDSATKLAEQLFWKLAPSLNLSTSSEDSGGGGSDGPQSIIPNSRVQNLLTNWDGLFPPKPPRPEDIVITNGDDQHIDTIQTAQGDQD